MNHSPPHSFLSTIAIFALITLPLLGFSQPDSNARQPKKTVAPSKLPPAPNSSGKTEKNAPTRNALPFLIDEATGVVHSGRLASGLPLGGIGSGGFQYMTDGSFSHAILSGNHELPTGDIPGCFAAVRTRSGDKIQAKTLALKSDYGLPVVSKLDFDGLYPQANLSFPENDLPVSVHLKAFSPIIPHDLKNSCYPAAAFIFRLENLTKEPVEASVALSWENLLGVGSSRGRPFHNRTGNTLAITPDNEGVFAIRMSGPASLDPLGTEFQQQNSTGDLCLITTPDYPQAIVTRAGWNALDAKPGWWNLFESDGKVEGVASEGVQGRNHPAGVIAVKITLKPREVVQIPFAFSWNLPHLFSRSGKDFGRYYSQIHSDSYASAKSVLADWRSLLALTAEWQNRLSYSNLPIWFVRKTINSASQLTSHSVFSKEGGFLLLNSTEERAQSDSSEARETPLFQRKSSRFGTSALASHSLLLDLFPVLASLQLQQWIAQKSIANPVHAEIETLDEALSKPLQNSFGSGRELIAEGPTLPFSSQSEFDNVSLFFIAMSKYVRETGDTEFLDRSFPTIRALSSALLQSLSAAGEPRNFDLNASSSILLLAALRAVEDLASFQSPALPQKEPQLKPIASAIQAEVDINKEADERIALAKSCKVLSESLLHTIQSRFWNGKIYGRIAQKPESNPLFIEELDALIGQWAADSLGLGGILPQESVSSALKALIQSSDNTKTIVSPKSQSETFELASSRALTAMMEKDLPGAVLIGGLLNILHGSPSRAVEFLHQEDRIAMMRSSPWSSPLYYAAENEKGEGVNSLTHAVFWNALEAIEGFNVNSLQGELDFVPRIPGDWRSLRVPLFTPTFWGSMEFKPTAKGELIAFRLDRLFALPSVTPSRKFSIRAVLALSVIRIPGPPVRPAGSAPIPSPVAHVSLGRVPIGVKSFEEPDGSLRLVFETPISMSAGDRLEIDLH